MRNKLWFNRCNTFDFTIPRGMQERLGLLLGERMELCNCIWNKQVVAYNGTSYIAVANNQNVRPDTDTTKWNVMAQAGAEGGSISSMEDTQIIGTVSDMAILAYDSNRTVEKIITRSQGHFLRSP